MWLTVLQQRSGLTKSDTLYIHIDKETFEYMNSENEIFGELLTSCPCNVKLLFYERPDTILEGTMFRYTVHDYKEDIYMYCDIDIFIVNSLPKFTEALKEDTLYIHSEGSLQDMNYGAAFSKEELADFSESTGFNSGKFLIRGKNLLRHFFKSVQRFYGECKEKNFLCLDQPYFNKAIYSMNMERLNTEVLSSRDTTISCNGYNYEKNVTVLLDNLGEAGNGEVHYTKMFKLFILLQAGSL